MEKTPLVVLPALTDQEDTFALAVIECGGNLGAAYKQAFIDDECRTPMAKARELMCRPEIAKRIHQLQISLEEHAMVSVGSHLVKLAEIRDLAVQTDQLKVALAAERSRGEVAGFYAGKGPVPKGTEAPKAAVNIYMSSTPASVNDWAAKHGRPAVIIENPT